MKKDFVYIEIYNIVIYIEKKRSQFSVPAIPLQKYIKWNTDRGWHKM